MFRVGGGENQRGSVTHFSGYSEKAHCTGKPTGTPAYLEPISGSMQNPIEGDAEKRGDRGAIGWKTAQNHVGYFI